MKNRITQLRKGLGMTQEELADKTGVTRQTIIALEQNRYNPSLGLAFSITKTLKRRAVEEVFKIN